MAAVIMTWNLPPMEQMEAYQEKAKNEWIPGVLKNPGLVEWQAFRNPLKATPEVMAIAKFDNLDSCLQYIRSEFYDTVTEEMKSMGCTCMVVQIWDASPVASEPLKPTQA